MSLDLASVQEHARAYQRATDVFEEAISKITPDNIDREDGQGWSARQIVHHMGDSESQSAARLRRILAQPGTQILGYDEAAWSECESMGYRTLPIENARATSLMVLNNLSEIDLDKFAIHSESGHYSLETWLINYIQHPIDHADQLLKAISQA